MMAAIFWVEAALLGGSCLLPVGLALRRGAPARDRRSPALALHRAQRRELERDRTDGLIEATEHQAARLEVERRLLAADGTGPEAMQPGGRHGWIALGLVLPAALGLYLIGGHPELPAQPLVMRIAQSAGRAREDEALISALRQGVLRLDPASPEARQGYVLLGEAEAARSHFAAAASAWRTALAHGFDATLAVQAAEAQSRADGNVSPESAALYRRALEAGPKDAPWRELAEQRLAQSEHQ